jgi:hypothetical protein
MSIHSDRYTFRPAPSKTLAKKTSNFLDIEKTPIIARKIGG